MADDSWSAEFAEFLDEIHARRKASRGLRDALAALEVVKQIYEESGHAHHP